MIKNKKNKIFKYIFLAFLLSFIVIYFSEVTGYYEYKNHEKAYFTAEAIKEFEDDIASGKEVDIKTYLTTDTKSYNNKLSDFTNMLSNGISDIVKSGVENTFKFISSFIEE